MKQLNWKTTFKKYVLISLALSNAAFTNFRFVELEGLLNGRSSAKFTRNSRNVLTTLPKGTRGEILKSKKFASGNYGVKIKVLSGSKKGQTFWVYHNTNNSNLVMYKSQPTHWDARDQKRETQNIREATNAETKEATDSLQDSPGNSDLSNNYGKDIGKNNNQENSGVKAIEAIEKANSQVKNTRDCEDCSVASTQSRDEDIQDYKQKFLGLPQKCSHLMSSNGKLGSTGKELARLMSQNKYADHFLNSNSLGALCPKFKNLSPDKKIHAWTYFWTILAFEESGCDSGVVHPTHSGGRRINPTNGFGLWAAETSNRLRAHRGQSCSDIRSAAGQARCAVDTMFSTQLRKGYTASNFSGSYWGPVRRAQNQLIPEMRNYEGCF